MDKYLLEILKEVNTIIIPGLGALTITNKDTGEIMFMDYLKHDDGKLAVYIAEKEGMDVNEAKNMIAKYVREITAMLDKGESYDMFEFGSFVKEGDSVEFKNWDGKSSSKSEPKDEAKESSEKKPVPEKTATKKPDAKKKTSTVNKTASKKAKSNKTDAQKSTEKPKETTKNEVEKPVEKKEAEEKVETPIVPVEAREKKELNIAEKEERDGNVKKLNALKEKQNKPEKKKRGVGFYILIIVAILGIGGGTATFIFYDDVKGYIPFLADNNNEEKETEQTELDKMKEMLEGSEEMDDESDMPSDDENIHSENVEESLVEEEVLEEEVEEIDGEPEAEVKEVIEESKLQPEIINEQAQTGFLPYHVILGSFTEESNAQGFIAKLQSEGYTNAKIMYGGGLHMVSAKSFATREEAEQSKSSIGKGWVLEWR